MKIVADRRVNILTSRANNTETGGGVKTVIDKWVKTIKQQIDIDLGMTPHRDLMAGDKLLRTLKTVMANLVEEASGALLETSIS